jgi:hypothetical protein
VKNFEFKEVKEDLKNWKGGTEKNEKDLIHYFNTNYFNFWDRF